jgi:hypothetical protein|tara:strand:+ start:1916 stop:2143 length:228 start_codon:yes stop_codon:yes gene_type:complete
MSKKSKIYPRPEDQLIWGVLMSIILVLCIWLCVMVYGVKQDVKDISTQLDIMNNILKPIENISDPVGLINHLKKE